MKIIALKLTSGREIMGQVEDFYDLQFGIREYEGKIPRKVFRIQKDKTTETTTEHRIKMHKAVEVLGGDAGQGFTAMLAPIYLTLGAKIMGTLGSDLHVHSNDVMGLNSSVDDTLSIVYRRAIGELADNQFASLHSEVPN